MLGVLLLGAASHEAHAEEAPPIVEVEDLALYPSSLTPNDWVMFKGAEFNSDIQSYFLGLSLPLMTSENDLLFLEAQFAWNDPLDEQINFGLAHRWLLKEDKNIIIGENVFFDYNNSRNGNGFGGVGTGFEILTPNFELHFNYYWPDNRQPVIGRRTTQNTERSSRFVSQTVTETPNGSSRSTTETTTDQTIVSTEVPDLPPIISTSTATAISTTTRQPFLRNVTNLFEDTETITTRELLQREAAMEGFDVEVGTPVPFLPDNINMWGFIGYYDFQNPFPMGEDSDGLKGRLEWRVNPNFTLETIYFDQDWPTTGGQWYSGFRFSCPLDDPENGLLATLFTPKPDSGFDSRWLQRIVRQRRFRFVEDQFREESLTTTTRTTTRSETVSTPFERVTRTLQTIFN